MEVIESDQILEGKTIKIGNIIIIGIKPAEEIKQVG